MNLQGKPFHVSFLANELERRKRSNPKYSLRAFARQLALDASALSRLISGKQEFSVHLCRRILTKLKFSEEERLLFIRSVGEEKKQRVCQKLMACEWNGTGS
jgi:transcriptional regulator with XRE-family HTH domain